MTGSPAACSQTRAWDRHRERRPRPRASLPHKKHTHKKNLHLKSCFRGVKDASRLLVVGGDGLEFADSGQSTRIHSDCSLCEEFSSLISDCQESRKWQRDIGAHAYAQEHHRAASLTRGVEPPSSNPPKPSHHSHAGIHTVYIVCVYLVATTY